MLALPMDPGPRAAFNRAWTPELYSRYCGRLEQALGPIPFRLAETPFFIAPPLRDLLTRSAVEIVHQLARPELLRELMKIIPANRVMTSGGAETPRKCANN